MKDWWQHERIRRILFQVILLSVILTLCLELVFNVQNNLAQRGIASGLGFLEDTAGFGIIFHLIAYSEASSYGRAFWVGLTNTLFVATLGIVLATVLGFLVGVASLSRNWLMAKIAYAYVEVIRNIPLLLQLFFWYFLFTRKLPHPRASIELGQWATWNNRGLYLVKVELTEYAWILGGVAVFLALGVGLTYRWAKKRQMMTGQPFSLTKLSLVAVGLFLAIMGIGHSLWFHFEAPELRGFNFQGGWVLIPEFLALLVGLSTYTAAFIGEIVRAGILAIPKGQWEAAQALGLNTSLVLNRVILPQAIRIILPPLTNQYLNLTKNSSLAAAIAYPDLVAVFAGTVLNQTGQAVEIIGITMAVYLALSLLISLIMQTYEKRCKWQK